MFRDITLEEAQQIEFELFLEFKRVCEENGLTYFLSGGTLLGAVRHGGFIPWDDDMDVMMPRADYDRLITLPLKLPEHVALFDCEKNDTYFYPYARLCDMRYRIRYEGHVEELSMGMAIDVFPIETLPDDPAEQKRYFRRLRLLDVMRNAARRQSVQKNEKHRAVKALLAPVARLRSTIGYVRKMNTYARSYIGKETSFSGVTMVTHYGMRELMAREVFEPGATVTFNGVDCPAPKGWDTYLTNLYGDYMKLPPEDKRVSEHTLFTIEERR